MGKKSELTEEQRFDKLINFVLWLFAIAILAIISESIWISDWNDRGVLGDWIGGQVAAIAGFATVVLLIKQLSLQRIQNKMQRDELSLTRDEMVLGRQVHEAQKRQLERQAEIAEKAALRSHLIELRASRAPLYSQFLRILECDNSGRLEYYVENDPGELDDKLHIIEARGSISKLIFVAGPLFRIDRYCLKLLSSHHFDDMEREELTRIMELLPTYFLDKKELESLA